MKITTFARFSFAFGLASVAAISSASAGTSVTVGLNVNQQTKLPYNIVGNEHVYGFVGVMTNGAAGGTGETAMYVTAPADIQTHAPGYFTLQTDVYCNSGTFHARSISSPNAFSSQVFCDYGVPGYYGYATTTLY
jgi:hypothetical protein